MPIKGQSQGIRLTLLQFFFKMYFLDKQKESLGAELQPLFITVDPMRDDVEAVKQYVQGTIFRRF